MRTTETWPRMTGVALPAPPAGGPAAAALLFAPNLGGLAGRRRAPATAAHAGLQETLPPDDLGEVGPGVDPDGVA